MRTPQLHRLLALFFVLAAFVAACGDDDGSSVAASGETTDDTTDETTDPPAEDVDDAAAGEAPEAIVSLSPVLTEMLFAIGAGDQVIAVDSLSNHPPEAPVTDLSAFDPNVEAIVGFEPDLVVFTDDRNELAAGLDTAGIDALQLPTADDLDDTYDQLLELGAVTGNEDEAAALVEEMRAEIDQLVVQVPERDEAVTYFHELDNTLYSVTSSTFIGEIYALVGLENIADAADPDGALGGYPQLSPELVLEADPDVVFLADTKCCSVDADEFASRPGFDQLTAVREGRIVELDDDIASRWGPRVVDLLRAIVEATADLPAA